MRPPLPYLLYLHLLLSAVCGWIQQPSFVITKHGNANGNSPLTTTNLAPLTCLDGSSSSSTSDSSSIAFEAPSSTTSVADDKAAILQVGAALDRGQAYNPTAGTYYKERLQDAKNMIQQFLDTNPDRIPQSMDELVGEWELVMTTYPKGIYRSSPTFLAVQEAYETYNDQRSIINLEIPSWLWPFGKGGYSNNFTRADLFFQLHELQAKLLKVNKIGRVAHFITTKNTTTNSTSTSTATLYSEFDTAIVNLNAIIPIVGWFKFLPEVGGSLVTACPVRLDDDGVLQLEVDYTTPRKVKGIWGMGKLDWRIPVGNLWRVLPWNQGRPPSFRLFIRYSDEDFRIVEDLLGEYFVYTKPVIPRPLDLVDTVASSSG